MNLFSKKSILSALDEYLELHSVSDKATFLVAFSGGCDSLCLLSALSALRPGFVTACYVNHNLRPEEELEKEIALNKKNINKLKVPFIIKTLEKGDVEALSKRENISTEAAAHTLRYEKLYMVMDKGRFDYLVTAHTSSDQTETLFMRLYTGSTLQALTGIRDRNDKILRPLMGVSRKETEAYCKAEGLVYSEDSTNAETVYLRNKIRHDLLPNIKELYPGLEKKLLNISNNMKSVLDKENELPIEDKGCYRELLLEPFFKLSIFGQSRALIALASPYVKGRVSKGVTKALYELCVKVEGRRDLDAFYARVRGKKLVLYPALATFVKVVDQLPLSFLDGFSLEKGSKSTDLSIDSSLICGKLIIRLTQEGDIICLNDKISLISDILSDQKVPYGFVLEDQKGIVALFTSILGGRDRLAKRFLSIAPKDEFLYSVAYR